MAPRFEVIREWQNDLERMASCIARVTSVAFFRYLRMVRGMEVYDMATQRKAALTLEGMIEKYGIIALAALRNPQLWEVVGGGIGGGIRTGMSAAAKKQLHSDLNAVYSALLQNAKAGDAISGAIAAQVAMGKAALH